MQAATSRTQWVLLERAQTIRIIAASHADVWSIVVLRNFVACIAVAFIASRSRSG